MESFFSRFRNALVLLAVLLVQTLGLAVQVKRPADAQHPDAEQVRLLRLWTLGLITPFERAFTYTGHGMRMSWANYVDLRHVRQRNAELERQVAQYKLDRAALAEDVLEAQRLRRLLDFKQQYVAATVVAQVVGTSGSDQSHQLTLDKGAGAGLKPEMPVITPDGVVGKLRDVYGGTAELLLLSDPTAGAGVLLGSSRIRAVVHGTPQGHLVITNLTQNPEIKVGETVLTSGGDQVFPRGLAVGTIESIVPDAAHPPYTLIVLKPAANLSRLDEVLVVTGTSAMLDRATEAELAGAPQHAADISAQRLPSLHPAGAEDGAATGEAAPPAENSTGLVPHPPAALRPDRYTPGTVPPAAALRPGAAAPAAQPPQPR